MDDLNMKRSRKQIDCVMNSLYSLKARNEYLKKEFVHIVGEQGFSQLQDIYNNAIEKLTQEKKTSPIGYRYTGIFYVKKPYAQPIQYERMNGSAFMREDLVSWRIETDAQYKDYYFRAIYRTTNDQENSKIKREESTSIYSAE